jgi:hypothetical protein
MDARRDDFHCSTRMGGPPFKRPISRPASSLARWITGQEIQADAGFINSMIAGATIQH